MSWGVSSCSAGLSNVGAGGRLQHLCTYMSSVNEKQFHAEIVAHRDMQCRRQTHVRVQSDKSSDIRSCAAGQKQAVHPLPSLSLRLQSLPVSPSRLCCPAHLTSPILAHRRLASLISPIQHVGVEKRLGSPHDQAWRSPNRPPAGARAAGSRPPARPVKPDVAERSQYRQPSLWAKTRAKFGTCCKPPALRLGSLGQGLFYNDVLRIVR